VHDVPAVRAPTILETAFPIAPTCLSLVNMDETDLAQLRQRIAIVRRIRRSLEGDLRLISSDCGRAALWFMQWRSQAINAGGLDMQQEEASMYLHHPAQQGVRTFRLEADVAMPRLTIDEKGARMAMDVILGVFDAILELPHGGHGGTPEEVAVAAARATAIVSALHANEGRNAPTTCCYVPSTPWRPAEIVRHRNDGGGPFLTKDASSVILANDPVCVSITKSDDSYHVKGAPNRHVVEAVMPDAFETMRILSQVDASISPSKALVRRRGGRS